MERRELARRLGGVVGPGRGPVVIATADPAEFQRRFADAAAGEGEVFLADPTWGEAVHAVVVVKPGHTVSEAELVEHCRARIARYKCPRSISLRTSPLPMSSVGKIRKVDLLAEWTQAQAQSPRSES